LEYWIPAGGNSGVSIRDRSRGHGAIGEEDSVRPDLAGYPKSTPAHIGYEIQILDYDAANSTGSIYELVPARTGVHRPGLWNSMDIESRASLIRVRVNGQVVLWRDIANAQPGSALYNQIVGWAAKIKAFGAPMGFIFNHEPEAAASDSMGTAQEFISAWQKVITVFREQGVTNAKYVWTMTDYAFWRTDGGRADLWYPGDAYVDAIASDSYNWFNCRPGINTAWHTLEWIAAHMRDFGLAHPDVATNPMHGNLTMSTYGLGECSKSYRTYGLGDVLGLQQLYP
jgi:hypothetical protein